MLNENGKKLEQALKVMGIDAKFVDEAISPQIATYFYDFVDINKYNKRNLEKVAEKLTLYYHIKFNVIYSDVSHFGLSIPLKQKQTLWLGSIKQPTDNNAISIGKYISNKEVELNFNKISHLLIAGTTGSGKSVLMNTIISALYMNMGGENFEMVIIDPKRTEFEVYKQLPNCTYVDETTDAIAMFNELVNIMEDRYNQMKQGKNDFKHLFVVVDELADLMLSSHYDIEETIVRLAQKSRACKIHLILATQRPTVNVITGLIKANMPNRICLKMASQIDSRTMLDHKGAEELLGYGDAIIKLDNSIDEKRFQCAMISKENITQAINELQRG